MFFLCFNVYTCCCIVYCVLLFIIVKFINISSSPDESEEAVLYQKLKAQYMTHTQDFLTMSRIVLLVSSLVESYAVSERKTETKQID